MPKTNFCKTADPFEVIMAARWNKRMKVYELCKAIGMPTSTWNRKQNRPETLTLEDIRKIDDALDLSDEQLVQLIRGRR